jgi:hypothetical protein
LSSGNLLSFARFGIDRLGEEAKLVRRDALSPLDVADVDLGHAQLARQVFLRETGLSPGLTKLLAHFSVPALTLLGEREEF